MKRTLIDVAGAISLLLCFLTGAIGVRSIWYTDDIGWTWPTGAAALVSSAGEIGFLRDWMNPVIYKSPVRPMGFTYHHVRRTVPLTEPIFSGSTSRGGGGFAIVSAQKPYSEVWMGVMPTWALFTILAVGAAFWVVHLRRRRRRERAAANLCVECGYDLRATPERCPECGTAVHPHQEAIVQQMS